MEGKANGDKLDLLKVRSEKVLVGETTLTLRTSTLMQQRGLVRALGKIDPAPLFEAARPVAAAASGQGSFTEALLGAGPDLYRHLTEFLAVAGGDALAEAAAALLDNEENFRTLAAGGEVDSAAAEREGKRYVGCEPLRAWVAGSVTPRQAFHVLTAAVRLNDYSALGEALAGLARKAAGSAPTQSLTKSTSSGASGTDSSGAETESSRTTRPDGGSQGAQA